MSETRFTPSREAALLRLSEFAKNAGAPYAQGRNYDPGSGDAGAVSRLSPYLRYRMITEAEVVAAVLARHSLKAAEKYVQEVLWRTYWKGWLEMRPFVWTQFLAELERQREAFAGSDNLLSAEAGRTGIDGFDNWVVELKNTGYLHNHARMWFASIWIFTLRLPWVLGADFFLRHLIDADAASNTLSWRWVAGLHTPGKTYLATRDNIARFSHARFAPEGLATQALALSEPPLAAAQPLPSVAIMDSQRPTLLLVTPEDMYAQDVVPKSGSIRSLAVVTAPELLWGTSARGFVTEAATDTASRLNAHYGCNTEIFEALTEESLIEAAQQSGATQIVTPYAPVGPTASVLARLEPGLARAGMPLVQVRRSWDTRFWPQAKKGFFTFKDHIPALLRDEGIGVGGHV